LRNFLRESNFSNIQINMENDPNVWRDFLGKNLLRKHPFLPHYGKEKKGRS